MVMSASLGVVFASVFTIISAIYLICGASSVLPDRVFRFKVFTVAIFIRTTVTVVAAVAANVGVMKMSLLPLSLPLPLLHQFFECSAALEYR